MPSTWTIPFSSLRYDIFLCPAHNLKSFERASKFKHAEQYEDGKQFKLID